MPSWRGWAGLAPRGELAELDPQFKPYLETRDGIKSQLEDLRVPAEVRRRDRGVACPAAAGGGAARAARTAQAEVRPDARRGRRAARCADA